MRKQQSWSIYMEGEALAIRKSARGNIHLYEHACSNRLVSSIRTQTRIDPHMASPTQDPRFKESWANPMAPDKFLDTLSQGGHEPLRIANKYLPFHINPKLPL